MSRPFVGEPFPLGQSYVAVRQPPLDTSGQSPEPARARAPAVRPDAGTRPGTPPSPGSRPTSARARHGPTLDAAICRTSGPAQVVHRLVIAGAGAGSRPGGSNLGAAVCAGGRCRVPAKPRCRRPSGSRPTSGCRQSPSDRQPRRRGGNRGRTEAPTIARIGRDDDVATSRIVLTGSRTGRSGGQSRQRRDEVRDQVATIIPASTSGPTIPAGRRGAITRPYRWATWAAITGWVGYGWSEPTSY